MDNSARGTYVDLMQPLQDAGFDLTRLRSGAALTAYRAIGEEALATVLAKAPEALREPAQRRLVRRGAEAWASHGVWWLWAHDDQQRAIHRLVKISQAQLRGQPDNWGLRSLRGAALRLLAEIISPGTVVDRESLVAQLAPLLRDEALDVRSNAATVLGALGSASAIAHLTPFRNDTAKHWDECQFAEPNSGCKQTYPLRDAVRGALERLRASQKRPSKRR